MRFLLFLPTQSFVPDALSVALRVLYTQLFSCMERYGHNVHTLFAYMYSSFTLLTYLCWRHAYSKVPNLTPVL